MPLGSKPTDGTPAGSSAPSSARTTTLYDTLGITLSATTEEVTTAYRKLALAYHPDRPDGLTEKFQELQRAYEVLRDPTSRARYDTLLKGKPALKNFKRPAKLEKVEKPVYALLADLAFYQFEGSPSKLRCSVHYGDGIEFNNERGSFIGLAGDGFLYWSVNGRGYATQLCKADSDMALSNMRVVYRSDMGLRRKPLERSRAGNYTPAGQPPQQHQRTGTRSSVGSPHSGGSGTLAGGSAGGAAPRLSEAERLRQQIRNKERHRSATKRLETIEREETDERNDLERYCWEKFCTLHTNLEAGMRCVTLGLPVTNELALFMGYTSLEEVPLACSPPGSFLSTAEHESPRVASLWVDPLQAATDDDDGEGGAAGVDVGVDDASDGVVAEERGGGGGRRGRSSPSVSSGGAASSSSPSDAASDGDSCRARPTAGPQAFNRTGYTAAYVSPQPSGSSPMVPGALGRPMVSAMSSLGNIQHSPMQPAPLRSMSWASSPVPYALPTTTTTATTPAVVGAHGLAAEPRAAQAPHGLHGGPQGGGTTVQLASGTQRPSSGGAAASAGRDHDGLIRVTSGQDNITRVSRASVPDADHPSLPNSLPSPPITGLPHDATGSTANRFISLLQATGESGTNISAVGASGSGCDNAATPTRPLYPWSVTDPIGTTVQRDLQTHGATPANGVSGSPVGTTHFAAPPNARADTSSPTRRGAAPVGEHSASPSPQPARERTSVFTSPQRSTAAGSASVPSPGAAPPMSLRAEDTTEGVEEQHILKVHPSLSPAAAGRTHDGSVSVSPRPAAPSQSLEVRKTPRAEATSGRSAAAQSCSRGDSGDGCTSYGAPSGATANLSQEEGQGVAFAAGATPGSTAAAGSPPKQAQETPRRRHLDAAEGAAEGSALRPSSTSHTPHPIPAVRGDLRLPIDASAARERGDVTVTSGGAVSSSGTTTATSATNPRVAIAPLRLSTSQENGFVRSAQDGELDAPLLSPDAAAAAAAEKRRRSKGRVTPRYMLATQAHSRRVSGIPMDGTGGGAPAPSPRLETIHAYNSMTVEEMLAEEEEFMNSFAKTKRVT